MTGVRRSALLTLRSAGVAAGLLAADVVLLVLFLNPRPDPAEALPALGAAVFLPYLVAGTVALYGCALLGSLFRWWPNQARAPVASFPWLTSLMLLAVSAAALLYWYNLLAYRHAIPVAAVRGLAASALALTTAALVLLAVGVDALVFPMRARGVSAALAVLAAGGAVVVPLASLPQPEVEAKPVLLSTESIRAVSRVVLVGIDGLGPRQLEQGVASGALPFFGRMLRRGAWGPLATIRPTEGPPIWTTILTGRLPRDHGVKSFTRYRLPLLEAPVDILPKGALVSRLEQAGLVTRSPATAASRRSPTLWTALNSFGVPAGMVRVWGTQPPERVQGFMLSHYFHLLRSRPDSPPPLYPPDLLAEVSARAVSPRDVEPAMLAELIDFSVEIPGDPVDWRRDLVERALAPDLTYARAAEVLRAAYDPPFEVLYFFGLDPVGHTFTRFAEPERFGDVSSEQVRRYGRVVQGYTALLGREVASIDSSLGDDAVLLVVSGYGLEPMPLWRRLVGAALGEDVPTATHAGAPPGVIVAMGRGVRPGGRVEGASVLDLAPTVLYLMGLPVARDMEGRVLTELLDDDFIRLRPVTYIPSYASLAVTPAESPDDVALPPLPEVE